MNLVKLLQPRSLVIMLISFIALIFVLCLSSATFFTVSPGERAIVLRWGNISEVVGPGPHTKLPFADKIVMADIRTQRVDTKTSVRTKDSQDVASALVLNYHLNSDQLAAIYGTTGLDMEDRIIKPRMDKIFKAVIAKYSAEELLKLRDSVNSLLESELRRDLTNYHVVVESAMITDFKFSARFNDAIEHKQIAEQSALAAVYDLNRIKTEADQKLVSARAEAEATKIQSEALKAQGGEDYVRLKAINKWDGKLPTYMTGAGTPFITVK